MSIQKTKVDHVKYNPQGIVISIHILCLVYFLMELVNSKMCPIYSAINYIDGLKRKLSKIEIYLNSHGYLFVALSFES